MTKHNPETEAERYYIGSVMVVALFLLLGTLGEFVAWVWCGCEKIRGKVAWQ